MLPLNMLNYFHILRVMTAPMFLRVMTAPMYRYTYINIYNPLPWILNNSLHILHIRYSRKHMFDFLVTINEFQIWNKALADSDCFILKDHVKISTY